MAACNIHPREPRTAGDGREPGGRDPGGSRSDKDPHHRTLFPRPQADGRRRRQGRRPQPHQRPAEGLQAEGRPLGKEQFLRSRPEGMVGKAFGQIPERIPQGTSRRRDSEHRAAAEHAPYRPEPASRHRNPVGRRLPRRLDQNLLFQALEPYPTGGKAASSAGKGGPGRRHPRGERIAHGTRRPEGHVKNPDEPHHQRLRRAGLRGAGAAAASWRVPHSERRAVFQRREPAGPLGHAEEKMRLFPRVQGRPSHKARRQGGC